MELSLLFSCFLLIPLLLLTLYYFLSQDPKSENTKHTHKNYPIIGDLLQVIKNRKQIFDWGTEILINNPTHTMVSRNAFFPSSVITANPKNIEYILKTKHENYPKSDLHISILEDMLGHGIFNSNGEHWRWQRKAVGLAFATRTLRGFMADTVRSEITHRLVPLIEKTREKGEVIEMQDMLERFAFDFLSRVVFDVDPGSLGEEDNDLMTPFTESVDLIAKRFPIEFVWRSLRWLDIGSEKKLRQSVARIKSYVINIIREKIENPSNNNKLDLISHVASSEEHTMDDLVDIVTNLLLAGKDSTATSLTWFFWFVSNRPDVEELILTEIRSIINTNPSSSNGIFGYDELKEMHYLHAAITESMRLYPPVPIDYVSCKEDDILPDKTGVKRGWLVGYHSYAIGRMEDIWGRDCREYRPERWLENNKVFRPESPFKYPVFHAGPRMCLGKDMAYVQMKAIAACLLERYKIEAVMDGAPEYETAAGTLKMKGGLPVRFRKRM